MMTADKKIDKGVKIDKIWFDGNRLYGRSSEGETFWQSLDYYKRLREASDEQRSDYEFTPMGIHWEELDEDVSFESFTYPDAEPSIIGRFFLDHPEINAAVFARKISVEPTLFASYLNGASSLPAAALTKLLQELKSFGKVLSQAAAEMEVARRP